LDLIFSNDYINDNSIAQVITFLLKRQFAKAIHVVSAARQIIIEIQQAVEQGYSS
jgi:hypothetical protein